MKISESGKKISRMYTVLPTNSLTRRRAFLLELYFGYFIFSLFSLFSESFKLDRDKEVGLKFRNAIRISVECFN